MALRIGPAEPADQKDIVGIGRQSVYTANVSNPSFTGEASYARNCVIKAVDSVNNVDTLVGFVCVTPSVELDLVVVSFLGVAVSSRRQGIGAALLDYVAWVVGGVPVELVCYRANEDGLAFYRRMGWETVSEDPKSVRMRRTASPAQRPGWVQATVGPPTARRLLSGLLSTADIVDRVVLAVPSEVALSAVRLRFPKAELVVGQMPRDHRSEMPVEVRRGVKSMLGAVDDRDGLVLDMNRLTLLDLRREKGWKRSLVDLAMSRRPRWALITDSALRYLHINFRSYGLCENSPEAYKEMWGDELRARGASSVSWASHYSATFILVSF